MRPRAPIGASARRSARHEADARAEISTERHQHEFIGDGQSKLSNNNNLEAGWRRDEPGKEMALLLEGLPSRRAHRRALAPIGARGLILSRIDYLIPNWLSYPESIIVSRVWGGGGGDREAGGEGDEEERERREEGMG